MAYAQQKVLRVFFVAPNNGHHVCVSVLTAQYSKPALFRVENKVKQLLSSLPLHVWLMHPICEQKNAMALLQG